MNIGEAVQQAMYRAFPLDEPKSPITSDRGLHAYMARLEKAYGSGPKAARAAGVSPETWRRWKQPRAKGAKVQRPGPPGIAKILNTVRPILRAARAQTAQRKLKRASSWARAVIRWGGPDDDDDYLNPIAHRASNLNPTDLTGIIRPWLAGDTAAAGLAFEAAISRQYGLTEPGEGIRFEGDDVTVVLNV